VLLGDAQCTDELLSKEFECKLGTTCHSLILVDLPDDQDGGIHYECHQAPLAVGNCLQPALRKAETAGSCYCEIPRCAQG